MQLNQGPQYALLYDNNRSYFTNVGYVRTSNFQIEYQDNSSQGGVGDFGQTLTFVIAKAADLMGPVDLVLDVDAASTPGLAVDAATSSAATVGSGGWAFVDEVGFAMIERATLSIGSNDIETLTGEQMQLRNELMTSDEMRLGYETVGKMGRQTGTITADNSVASKYRTRFISHVTASTTHSTATPATVVTPRHRLIVPLNFFFTRHVSQYFPLAAIAGCNDVRIQVKLRRTAELVMRIPGSSNAKLTYSTPQPKIISSALRTHYVHVTGPEATTLMNMEHVRLMKLWQHNEKRFAAGEITEAVNTDHMLEMDLQFLHPVTELIIVIRKQTDIDNIGGTNTDKKCGYFQYHGDGEDPTVDADSDEALNVNSIQVLLNQQDRHSSLTKGIPVDYLRHRLLPMLHSNSNAVQRHVVTLGTNSYDSNDFNYHMQGSKNIFVYPFSLNPEGSNPSGAVNFSKVSHAKLRLYVSSPDANGLGRSGKGGFRVDVYGTYYNWLQIKDGRALLSFA